MDNNTQAKLKAIIQLDYDLAATALSWADNDTERAVSILETAIMTLQAVRLPNMGALTPQPGRVLRAA